MRNKAMAEEEKPKTAENGTIAAAVTDEEAAEAETEAGAECGQVYADQQFCRFQSQHRVAESADNAHNGQGHRDLGQYADYLFGHAGDFQAQAAA